jgi:hypothetical protein
LAGLARVRGALVERAFAFDLEPPEPLRAEAFLADDLAALWEAAFFPERAAPRLALPLGVLRSGICEFPRKDEGRG